MQILDVTDARFKKYGRIVKMLILQVLWKQCRAHLFRMA